MYMLWGGQNDGAKAAPRQRQGCAKVLHGKNGLPTPKKSSLGGLLGTLGTDFGAQEMSGEQKCQNLKISRQFHVFHYFLRPSPPLFGPFRAPLGPL